tara:strand:+ start:642 stop:770 length:129 start_codon:yes stop_codon:yes gene_type:complete
MIKKLYFLILIYLLTLSCGKRGDPVYEQKKSQILNPIIKKIS